MGISFIIPEFNIKGCKRINDESSVYTGEMMALLLAVQWVEEVRPWKTVICSDSSSSLISIKYGHSDSRKDILLEIQQTIFRIQMMGLSITFVWIPAHVGLSGNETADRHAKEATRNNHIDIQVPFSKTEMKTRIKHKLKERWQKQWEEERTGRWFYRIQRQVGVMRKTARSAEKKSLYQDCDLVTQDLHTLQNKEAYFRKL